MPIPARTLFLLSCALLAGSPAQAQLPFYTDDPAVTEKRQWHFEFFDELDSLQLQHPNRRQNTANFKLNYGLPHNLELDVDFPYLAIIRDFGTPSSAGGGDFNLGVKWEFHKESPKSHTPAMGVSMYFEFPTGDTRQQLGSGLTDYWLNLIAQKSITSKTRINGNIGYLFAGNTSTGALGLETTRGHVFAGGVSVLHDFTTRLTLGSELYGAYTTNGDLGRSQFQAMVGGQYALRKGFSLTFGLVGGKYIASPRIGGQVGISVDFPSVIRAAEEPPPK